MKISQDYPGTDLPWAVYASEDGSLYGRYASRAQARAARDAAICAGVSERQVFNRTGAIEPSDAPETPAACEAPETADATEQPAPPRRRLGWYVDKASDGAWYVYYAASLTAEPEAYGPHPTRSAAREARATIEGARREFTSAAAGGGERIDVPENPELEAKAYPAPATLPSAGPRGGLPSEVLDVIRDTLGPDAQIVNIGTGEVITPGPAPEGMGDAYPFAGEVEGEPPAPESHPNGPEGEAEDLALAAAADTMASPAASDETIWPEGFEPPAPAVLSPHSLAKAIDFPAAHARSCLPMAYHALVSRPHATGQEISLKESLTGRPGRSMMLLPGDETPGRKTGHNERSRHPPDRHRSHGQNPRQRRAPRS